MSAEVDEKRERFRELLEELRVIIPGTEVLFAFLLTAPFSQRFADLDPDERALYAVALVATAAATVLLVAPTVYHRMEGRQRRDERLRASVRMAMAGVGCLAVGVVSAIHVVTAFVWGEWVARGATALIAGIIAVLWYALPLAQRLRG